MKKAFIKVAVKEPGHYIHLEHVENTLEAFQRLVGGHIETITIATGCVIICNDEGLLSNLPYNCRTFGADFYGTIVLCGVDGENFSDLGLTNRQLKLLFPMWFVQK